MYVFMQYYYYNYFIIMYLCITLSRLHVCIIFLSVVSVLRVPSYECVRVRS